MKPGPHAPFARQEGRILNSLTPMTLCTRVAPFRNQSPWTSWLFLPRYLGQDGLTRSGMGLVTIFMSRSYTTRSMGLGRCAVIYFARLENYNSTLTSFGSTNVNCPHGIKHAPRLPQSIGRKSSYGQQLSLKKPPISSFRSRTARKTFHLWYSTAGTLRLQAQEN